MFRRTASASACIGTLITLGLLAACSVPAVRKETPRQYEPPTPSVGVGFNLSPGIVHEVDLGSLLFRWTMRLPAQVSLAAEPIGTDQPFPGATGWVDSWTYTGPDAPGAMILTHPLFYNSVIGVITAPDGELLTPAPLLQVEGTKKGRRWRASGSSLFRIRVPLESWALRYGGERDGGHRFMIVEYADDKERDVVQDFRVSFEDAAKGFSVKGVFVKIHAYGAGKIRYSFQPT